MDEQDGIHVSTNVIKEASDECWGGDNRQIDTKEYDECEKMTKEDWITQAEED